MVRPALKSRPELRKKSEHVLKPRNMKIEERQTPSSSHQINASTVHAKESSPARRRSTVIP